jgi:hypothetical protein
MESVVGVFALREDGERAVGDLLAAGVSRDRITLLTPHASDADVRSVPTTEAEPPGIGRALGAVAGAAAGAGGGMQAGALVSLFVPGVGPVLALGALGALLLGVGGAAIGAAIDHSLREGLPRDELYVYEDALRQGKTVVIGLPESPEHAVLARRLLASAGAESIDAAREQWWLGLRDAERAEYTKAGGDSRPRARSAPTRAPTRKSWTSCGRAVRTCTSTSRSARASRAGAAGSAAANPAGRRRDQAAASAAGIVISTIVTGGPSGAAVCSSGSATL